MDSCSWIHGYTNADATGSNNSFMSGYAASCCSPGEFPQQQQLVSSQIQHHLNQISMHMSIDDESAVSSMLDDLLKASSSTHHGGAGSFPSSSSSSASFRSASVSCSPQSSAAAPELPATGGVFRRYARHLRPRRLPKPGACGQRMFKTAMSVLAKMHVAATFSRQYYYQQAVSALAAAAEAAPPPSGNQLQHMISERKRREKLNDSFLALKAVLPPGSKKDKASILTRAREHVKSLESKLSELEEKNRELEARLASRPSAVAAKNDKGETAAVPDTGDGTKRKDLDLVTTSGGAGAVDAAAPVGGEETCTLNVDLRRGGGCGDMSTTDVVLRTLQCLREQIGDGANLVAMSTSAGSGGRPPSANLTLQLKLQPPGVSAKGRSRSSYSSAPRRFSTISTSMRMNMDDDDQSAVYGAAMVDNLRMPSSTHHAVAAGRFPSSSSSSASFRSTSVSYGPETSATVATTGFQYPEISSQAPLPPPLVHNEAQHGGDTAGLPPPLPRRWIAGDRWRV